MPDCSPGFSTAVPSAYRSPSGSFQYLLGEQEDLQLEAL